MGKGGGGREGSELARIKSQTTHIMSYLTCLSIQNQSTLHTVIHVHTHDTKPHILLQEYIKSTIISHKVWPPHATTTTACRMSNATKDPGTVFSPGDGM